MKKTVPSFLASLFLLGLIMIVAAESKSQPLVAGPNNPSVVIEQNAGCLSCPGSSWMDPMNAEVADGVSATTLLKSYLFCFQSSCFYSRALMATGFGFNVPAGATITGVKAELLCSASLSLAVTDTVVQLLKAGIPAGSNQASGVYWPLMASTYTSYGDSANLWGDTWSPTDINAADFGFYLKIKNMHSGSITSFDTAYLDHIRITVYYQTATGMADQQSSDDMIRANYDALNEQVIVSVKNSVQGFWKITISDFQGKIVGEEEIGNSSNRLSFIAGRHQTKINCSGLASGVYFIQATSGNLKAVKKFIKNP